MSYTEVCPVCKVINLIGISVVVGCAVFVNRALWCDRNVYIIQLQVLRKWLCQVHHQIPTHMLKRPRQMG